MCSEQNNVGFQEMSNVNSKQCTCLFTTRSSKIAMEQRLLCIAIAAIATVC